MARQHAGVQRLLSEGSDRFFRGVQAVEVLLLSSLVNVAQSMMTPTGISKKRRKRVFWNLAKVDGGISGETLVRHTLHCCHTTVACCVWFVKNNSPIFHFVIIQVAGVLLFNTSDLLERAREVLRSQPKIKNMKQLKRQIPLAPDDWMRLEETPGSIHFRDEILTPPF